MVASFGEYFKRLRLKRGLTLRQFCSQNGFDPGNISRIERGIFPPPEAPEKIEEYALSLGLERGGGEWIEFFDCAAVSRGEIPRDVLSDEAIVRRLPVLFRTLSGRKVAAEKLDELIAALREADDHGA